MNIIKNELSMFFLRYYGIGFLIFRFLTGDTFSTFGRWSGLILFPFGFYLFRSGAEKITNSKKPLIRLKYFFYREEGYWKVKDGYSYGSRVGFRWFLFIIFVIFQFMVGVIFFTAWPIGVMGMIYFIFDNEIPLRVKNFLKK